MEVKTIEALDDMPVGAASESGGGAGGVEVGGGISGAGGDHAATLGAALGRSGTLIVATAAASGKAEARNGSGATGETDEGAAGQTLVQKIAHGYSNQALICRIRGAYYRQVKTNGTSLLFENPFDERFDFRAGGKSNRSRDS